MRRYQANADTPSRAAARIIRAHYGLHRPVTPDECHAEVMAISRKRAAGALDDSQERLCARLINAGILSVKTWDAKTGELIPSA